MSSTRRSTTSGGAEGKRNSSLSIRPASVEACRLRTDFLRVAVNTDLVRENNHECRRRDRLLGPFSPCLCLQLGVALIQQVEHVMNVGRVHDDKVQLQVKFTTDELEEIASKLSGRQSST